MSTTFCAVSVNASVASWRTSGWSTLDEAKSKPAKSRCRGNLAANIWCVTERMARSVCSACSKCSISHCDAATAASSCSVRSIQAPTMPCKRSSLSSAAISRMVGPHQIGAVGA
jgi:hypothetical protein